MPQVVNICFGLRLSKGSKQSQPPFIELSSPCEFSSYPPNQRLSWTSMMRLLRLSHTSSLISRTLASTPKYLVLPQDGRLSELTQFEVEYRLSPQLWYSYWCCPRQAALWTVNRRILACMLGVNCWNQPDAVFTDLPPRLTSANI